MIGKSFNNKDDTFSAANLENLPLNTMVLNNNNSNNNDTSDVIA